MLKTQDGLCGQCRLRFMAGDVLEVHDRDGNRTNNAYNNLVSLHGHCHDEAHAKRCL